jgi:hypothetical protein
MMDELIADLQKEIDKYEAAKKEDETNGLSLKSILEKKRTKGADSLDTGDIDGCWQNGFASGFLTCSRWIFNRLNKPTN